MRTPGTAPARASANDPFYVDASAVRKDAGWVQAGDLRVGDRLRDASGRDATVEGVRYNVGRAVMYTLTVGTDHTFFVGAARVLVHNATCDSTLLARAMAKVRGIARPYAGWAAHHIVPNKGGGAWGSWRATCSTSGVHRSMIRTMACSCPELAPPSTTTSGHLESTRIHTSKASTIFSALPRMLAQRQLMRERYW